MQNARPSTRRQTWITTYRVATVCLLVAVVAMCAVLVSRPPATSAVGSINNPSAALVQNKVGRAITYLQDAGFKNPVYEGILPASEGSWPTFTVITPNGKSAELMIRTFGSGSWEIQPRGQFESVSSAYDFANKASMAVSDWHNRTNLVKSGTSTLDILKYDYEYYKGYAPKDSFWDLQPSETAGWSGK